MKQNEIRPDDEQPSLQERIGDNSIERGIPTDLNVKSRSTMKNMMFLFAALAVAGVSAAALFNYSGGSDEVEKKTEEEVVDGKADSKNFKAEQDEILEKVGKLEVLSALASKIVFSLFTIEALSTLVFGVTKKLLYISLAPNCIVAQEAFSFLLACVTAFVSLTTDFLV